MTPEQRSLLAWGRTSRRDLPWRRTRDPWAVVVSEVMLQQTQAARVVPRFESFLRLWPTPSSLAAASLSDVLIEWSGLGYPRRARYLHIAAHHLVVHNDGNVPDRLDELLALPGIGAYTARAVLAFAFESDVGVVDTNIARVLARRAGRRLSGRDAQELADEFVPSGRSWEHNQSLMDLGASLCRPTPQCVACPLAGSCEWHRGGNGQPDPAIGSAGVSGTQGAFAGSNRQARGRLLRALERGPVPFESVAVACGLAGDLNRSARVAESLVDDGLARRFDGALSLGSDETPRSTRPVNSGRG